MKGFHDSKRCLDVCLRQPVFWNKTHISIGVLKRAGDGRGYSDGGYKPAQAFVAVISYIRGEPRLIPFSLLGARALPVGGSTTPKSISHTSARRIVALPGDTALM